MTDCKMMGIFYKQGKTKFMLTHVVKYGKSRFVLYVYTYFRFILFVSVTLKLAIILRLLVVSIPLCLVEKCDIRF